jgi:hypothetical protein
MMRLAPKWQGWSDEARALMERRNDGWQQDYDLLDAPYGWTLLPPELVFERDADEVVAELCFVGSYALEEGDFLWAWGNTTIDRDVREGLEVVRRFGAAHGWSLLTEPRIAAEEDIAELLAAIAGRVQDAVGTFVDVSGDMVLAFTIQRFRVRPISHR